MDRARDPTSGKMLDTDSSQGNKSFRLLTAIKSVRSWKNTVWSRILTGMMPIEQQSLVTTSIGQAIDDGSQEPQAIRSFVDLKHMKVQGFRFLDLPCEIRVLVYIDLFSRQMLKPFHVSELHNLEKFDRPDSYVISPMTFGPVPSTPQHFGILLANRRCFHEGISHYYKHCTVLNATYIEGWQHEAMKAYLSVNSARKTQAFVQSYHYYNRTEEIISAEGITSNAWLVIEATQKIIEDSRIFFIDHLPGYRSLQDVLVRMPRKEFAHWPELQETIPLNTRPSDEQLRHYHEGVLPAHEIGATFWWRKGLRQRTHRGEQATMESELLTVMQSMPRTTFRARIPVTYTYEDEEIWEICEYDLRTLKLIDRKQVPQVEIEREGFGPPVYRDDHYGPWNRY